MRRRAMLQSLAAAATLPRLTGIDLLAQGAAPALTPAQVATLQALAQVVLPSALGASGRDDAVRTFVGWVRNYKEQADRGHGYGNSQLSTPTGSSPAARYPEQFAALDTAARASGAASFVALSIDGRRAVVTAALEGPPAVRALPAHPTGANLVADFMGLYFNGPDARDLCYQAAIGRDTCRGLDGSDQAPPPFKGPGTVA
jgi:hypothetical protein